MTSLLHLSTQVRIANLASFTDYDRDLRGYYTTGGTFAISTTGKYSDDFRPRDLFAILPADIGQGRVLVLNPTVNPDLASEIRQLMAAQPPAFPARATEPVTS